MTGVAAAVNPAHDVPAWVNAVSPIVIVALSVALFCAPGSWATLLCLLASLSGVGLVLGLDLATRDASAAAQVFFCLPVLFAASQLRVGGVAIVTAAALAGDAVVAGTLQPSGRATTNIVYIGFTLLLIASLLCRSGFVQDRLVCRLRSQAVDDALTGLANRRGLFEALSEALPTGGVGALLLVDLDGFKPINDRFGHATGDLVLLAVAERLSQALPSAVVVARLGGDEFAAALPEASDEDSMDMARVVAESIAAPIDIEGRRHVVRASIGVSFPEVGMRNDELLRRADVAMYHMKRTAGSVGRYDAQTDTETAQRELRLQELRTFLDPDHPEVIASQLAVFYQPQIRLTDNQLIGAEALVRWVHPTLGVLPPAEFLSLVELHGLMGSVTRHVVTTAVAQAAQWRDHGHPLRVSVNLSTSSLSDPDLIPLIDHALRAHHLDPGSLTLEITETSIMHDPQHALGVLTELASRGLGIAIDDYGTGYSSLAYLNDLPADELKLDQAFIQRLHDDPRTAAIVTATVELAHTLGIRVVAEGVENLTNLAAVTNAGCDISQGYLHARPIPPDMFDTWRNLPSGKEHGEPTLVSKSGREASSRPTSRVAAPPATTSSPPATTKTADS